jgi:protein-disulfide isomerase
MASKFVIVIQLALVAALAAFATACAPSASQLQKTMEDHPEILFNAIEKNPDKFMDVVQKAAEKARGSQAERAQKEEEQRLTDEMKNPLKPVIDENSISTGPKDAPIQIVEYSDFQCPFCQRGYMTMEELLKKYDGKVHFVYKNLPLPMHPMALPAAKRFQAIALQSPEKAFKYYPAVFANQQKLNSEGEKFLDTAAKKAGADLAKMKKDMDSEKVSERLKADQEEAQKFGISGTPGFIVNGVSVRGAYPISTFDDIISKTAPSVKGG